MLVLLLSHRACYFWTFNAVHKYSRLSSSFHPLSLYLGSSTRYSFVIFNIYIAPPPPCYPLRIISILGSLAIASFIKRHVSVDLSILSSRTSPLTPHRAQDRRLSPFDIKLTLFSHAGYALQPPTMFYNINDNRLQEGYVLMSNHPQSHILASRELLPFQ
jgi:hypothetical protein